MVRILVVLLLAVGSIANAMQFEAVADQTNVNLNQSIQLKLLLTDAKAKEEPDLSVLEESFIIQDKQQFKSYSYVNGSSKSETGWQIRLLPKSIGTHVIPAVTVTTKKGVLSTRPITVNITQTAHADLPVQFEVGVSKSQVFVQEAFVVTVKIISSTTLANVQLDKLNVADCIIEEIAKPKEYNSNINGKRVKVIEIKYSLIPLKAGRLEIPALTFRGEAASRRQAKRGFWQPFGDMEFMDPFKQFSNYEPFAIQSDSIAVNIKPPLVQPWLPLYDLQVAETWDGLDRVQVGESITRNITLSAIGASGQQLPSLQAQQETTGVKIYADNPELKKEFATQTDKVIGTRIEHFSIIPQNPGQITMPAIAIKWWDITANKEKVTQLPAKVFAVNNAQQNNITADSAPTLGEHNLLSERQQTTNQNWIRWLYFAIACLIVALAGVFIFLWRFKLRMRHLLAVAIQNPEHSRDLLNKAIVVSPKDKLTAVQDLAGMRDLIYEYAKQHWQITNNCAVKAIPLQLQQQGYSFDEQLANNIFVVLEQALYGGGVVDLAEIKAQWLEFIRSVATNNKASKPRKYLSKLNPT